MMLSKVLARISRQAGYALVEILITVAILGLLSAGVNASIVQTIRMGSHSSEYITALKQVENAVQRLIADIQQAQTIVLTPGEGFPIDLSWVDWNGTNHAITYQIAGGGELQRIYTAGASSPQQTVVGRYIDSAPEDTNCWFADSGSFNLPDAGDSFTVVGGEETDDGLIVTTTGGISVDVTGSATYDAGVWAAPATGDSIVVTASNVNTRGIWTSSNMNALVSLSEDNDGDAAINGNALILKLTAYGGDDSERSETRIALIFPRSRM
jgi:prepilin-type N-terminal cleavage/methylation domain-containing protein